MSIFQKELVPVPCMFVCSGSKWSGDWAGHWVVEFLASAHHPQLLHNVQVNDTTFPLGILLCMGHRKVGSPPPLTNCTLLSPHLLHKPRPSCISKDTQYKARPGDQNLSVLILWGNSNCEEPDHDREHTKEKKSSNHLIHPMSWGTAC